MIPASALGQKHKDGTYDIRVPDAQGVLQTRKVKIGLNNNVNAQVLSGLKQGEQVVIGQAVADADSDSDARRGPPPPH